MTKHICKCKFSSTCNSNQNLNHDKCPCECRKYRTCKKVYSWNLSICICENGKYLENIADTLVILLIFCDRIINAADIALTNVKNTIPASMENTTSTNVMITVSINSDDKKVRYEIDCYLFYTLLLIILLFKIVIVCYHCTRHRSKQKGVGAPTI